CSSDLISRRHAGPSKHLAIHGSSPYKRTTRQKKDPVHQGVHLFSRQGSSEGPARPTGHRDQDDHALGWFSPVLRIAPHQALPGVPPLHIAVYNTCVTDGAHPTQEHPTVDVLVRPHLDP